MQIIKFKKCNYEHQGVVLKEYNGAYSLKVHVYPLSNDPYETWFVNKNEIEYIK
ncbi:hypothetical protein [Paenibacillus elgii]|uniref:hypothetical protein n=1 Tax=Paenibacillus elgii TaxID=189691 RepID=UPI000248C7D7|nr:hypothetical protein [Paenibacillus elgii]